MNKRPSSLIDPLQRSTLLYLVLPAFLFLFSQCDETPGTVDPTESAPRVLSVNINPELIQFSSSSGIRDTLVAVTVEASVELPASSDTLPRFRITNTSTDTLVASGQLNPGDGEGTYRATFDLDLRTTDFNEYRVFVFVYDHRGEGNQGYQNLLVSGFSNQPPEILWANNPDTAKIPPADQVQPVYFRAKVTDSEGQNNIDRVLMDFVQSNGESLTPTPFTLLDDGQSENPEASGDQVARDSVYTRRLFIDQSNTPQTYDVYYWSVDKGGLSSDTLQTTFTITE